MRVFVLGTGRCGTTTFIRACEHLSNYTAGHETRSRMINADRFAYPDGHIEADNRLTWFLGELGNLFPDAYYVHLRRNPDEVAESFLKRWGTKSIIGAFGSSIVQRSAGWPVARQREVCRFYVDTVTANIEAFLVGRDATTMWLHEAETAFPLFLERIGAHGDLAAACAEWSVRHNETIIVAQQPAPPAVPVQAGPPVAGTHWWPFRT